MVITSEEKTLIADAIILELTLETLEEEHNSIEESKNILRRAHHIVIEGRTRFCEG